MAAYALNGGHQWVVLNAFAHSQGALQGKARNFPFSHEGDARMGLRVDDELFEHLGARRSTGDAVVRAHRYHATPRSGFGIERVELRFEIVGKPPAWPCRRGGMPPPRRETPDRPPATGHSERRIRFAAILSPLRRDSAHHR